MWGFLLRSLILKQRLQARFEEEVQEKLCQARLGCC